MNDFGWGLITVYGLGLMTVVNECVWLRVNDRARHAEVQLDGLAAVQGAGFRVERLWLRVSGE